MEPPSQYIFRTSTGPIHVFVEASDILNRPKLIRALRNSGALISHSPADAHIILVDSSTDAGLRFVTDWGSDPGKVVLDAQWAWKSIKRGRLYLEDEGWGGFQARGESSNQESANGAGLTEQSPLPTPRTTPPDVGSSNINMPPPSQQITAANYSILCANEANGNGVPFPLQSPAPPMSQFTSNIGMISQVDPAQMTARMVATLMDVIQSQSQALNQGNIQLFAQAPGQMPMGILPSQYMQQDLPSQNSGLFPHQAGFFTQPLYSGVSGLTNGSMLPFNSSYRLSDGRAASSTPGALPPSLKRKKSPNEESRSSYSSRSKGKERAPSYDHPALRDISPDRRHSPSGPSAREQKGLFTNKAGEPLHFVVQVDIRNRKTIVDGIKKNGGKIISEISQADYVILTQSSRSFKDLLKQTENAERPAVQAQLVYDCIEKQTLLDEREYLFQDTLPKKKRGRPSGQTPVKSQKMETPTKEKAKELERATPQTKKMGTAEKPQKTKEVKVKSKPKEEPDSLSFQGLWEPSPPPPVRVVEYVDGRNLYTKEDRDYFAHYLSILAKRNPEMTYASIGEKMYSKMPHHTVKSWTAFAQKQKDQIDTAKKKAHIARRKAAESRRQQSSSQPSVSSVPSAGSSEGPSLKQAVSPVDEFKTMTEFFASGGADQISDHEVWVTLAEVYPSRTAQGWHDFWREHSEEIDTEVKRLCNLRDSELAAQGIANQQPKLEPEE